MNYNVVKTFGTILGVGAPPIFVYFSGDWDVHWGYGLLTHDQMFGANHSFHYPSLHIRAQVRSTSDLLSSLSAGEPEGRFGVKAELRGGKKFGVSFVRRGV